MRRPAIGGRWARPDFRTGVRDKHLQVAHIQGWDSSTFLFCPESLTANGRESSRISRVPYTQESSQCLRMPPDRIRVWKANTDPDARVARPRPVSSNATPNRFGAGMSKIRNLSGSNTVHKYNNWRILQQENNRRAESHTTQWDALHKSMV